MLHRIVLLTAGLASLWIVVALAVRVAYRGKVRPRTEVAGVALGGTTDREARQRLAALANRPRPFTVRADDRRETADVADIGLRLDAERTLRRASNAGRDGPTEGIVSTLTRLVATHRLEPAYAVDRDALDAWTRTFARKVHRPGFPGALSIDLQTLAVRPVAPRRGAKVDRGAAATAIEDAVLAGRSGVGLRLRRTRVPSRQAVAGVAGRARAHLSRPMTVTVAGRRRTITRRVLAGVLALERVPGREPRVRLGVRRDRVRDLVRRLAFETDRAAVDARLSAPAVSAAVTGKGDLIWRPRPADVEVSAGRSGLGLDQAAAVRAIARAVRGGRHRAELPVRVDRPAVTASAARRARRLIGTFTTRYACCEARAQNIRRIARAVDGTVIAPGTRFSLNGIAGPRTRDKGYVPAPYIADGKIVPSVGGGVSQFATTMFNAAYFAGLRLDAHQPHSIYIDRYPPGREATVDFGSIDLAWTNDTDVPVLVRASSTATSVSVALYGDNGGRRVRARPGARRPVPGGTFSITVTREIRYRDGRVVRQPQTTTYDRPPADG